MYPLMYSTVESARLLRHLLRNQFPDVRCSVRVLQKRNRREDSSGLLVRWETGEHDGAIARLSQTFCRQVFSPAHGEYVESCHYVGPGGVVLTAPPGEPVPAGKCGVVFLNDYVIVLPKITPAVVEQQRPLLRLVRFR